MAVLALTFMTVFVLSTKSTQVHAGDNPTAVLILDSSKSMWGQINGKNKVIIAREALVKAFKQSARKINLGIVAYGHRKTVGCMDIESVLSPRPIDVDVFKETIGNIRPRGSTPIAQSLAIAARAAGSPKVPATIVLLSDGVDNCRKDPCAMAKKLKAQSSALKIDVIAFDNQTQHKLAALQCVSENTGGKFYTATDAKELEAALKASFLDITGPQSNSPSAANALKGWDTNTFGNAGTSKNGASGASDIAGLIEADRDRQLEGFGKTEVMPTTLPNTTIISRTPTPDDNKNASGDKSTYRFSAKLSEDGKKIPNGLIWRAYSVAQKRGAKPLLIDTSRAPSPVFHLKPGRYLITATYGKAHSTLFHTAKLSEEKSKTIILNAGGLRLGSVLANGAPINKEHVRFDIYSDERDQFSKRKKLMKDARPGLIIRLNSGIYHLISTYGDANARVEADVTVEAGKLTEAAVNHSSGKVTFKLVRKEGGEAMARTRWHIKTANGVLVTKSIGAFPTHILAAGNYQITASNNGKKFAGNFKIAAGEVKQVEVMAGRRGGSAEENQSGQPTGVPTGAWSAGTITPN